MMNRAKDLHMAIWVALAIAVTGCAGKPEPFAYHRDNELKPGPGLISGEAGAFTIYRKPMEPETASPPEAGTTDKSGDKVSAPPGQ